MCENYKLMTSVSQVPLCLEVEKTQTHSRQLPCHFRTDAFHIHRNYLYPWIYKTRDIVWVTTLMGNPTVHSCTDLPVWNVAVGWQRYQQGSAQWCWQSEPPAQLWHTSHEPTCVKSNMKWISQKEYAVMFSKAPPPNVRDTCYCLHIFNIEQRNVTVKKLPSCIYKNLKIN